MHRNGATGLKVATLQQVMEQVELEKANRVFETQKKLEHVVLELPKQGWPCPPFACS